VQFDEPDRETAVRACLRAFKSMPAADHAEYLEYLAGVTGSRRCPAGPEVGLWMTWEMLREMRSAGMTIGGHTATHPVLARLPQPAQRDEIVACARRITAEIGEPMRCFSYPVGGLDAFDAGTRVCLREAGVQYAFSYYGGYRTFGDWDNLDVRRIAIERESGAGTVRAIATLPWLFGRNRRARRTAATG
jgi:peptidoglycan/xylan/chitin deacetylase (PgdA/CDA1 family)